MDPDPCGRTAHADTGGLGVAPWRRRATAAALVAALAAVVAAGPAAAVVALPPDLGPIVRVGLAFGSAAPAGLTVGATADPDVPVVASEVPAVSVAVAVSLASANGAADAGPVPANGAVATWTVAAPVSALAVWALGPATVDVLGQGMSAAAAAQLAAGVPGAAVAALGPPGLSVVVPTALDTAVPVATLTASGALAGPYPDLATARRAARALAGAGLWALPAFVLGPGGAGTWDVRVLTALSGSNATPGQAAQGAVAATSAALAHFAPAAPVTALDGAGSSLLAVVGGKAVIAPALLAAPASGALSLSLSAAPASGQVASYAGDLAIARVRPGGGLWVVNDVPLERYVAGVVPAEMPSSWPVAALEAQAVASRTYALYEAQTRPASAPYSLTDTASDQVYGGLGVETAATNAAAWATAGQVLTYRGAPIAALYEADSGGVTANSVDVWGNPVPYLAQVEEPRGFVSPHRWRIALSPQRLRALAIAATGTDPGPVVSVTPIVRERGSERVLRLALTGPNGTAYLMDDGVRTGLGLPSNVFRVTAPGAVEVQGATSRRRLLSLGRAAVRSAAGPGSVAAATTLVVQSATAVRTVPAAPAAFVFVGQGLGPGLGMSQDGARFMANRGDSARQILLYYYRGVALSQWYGEGSA